MDAHDPRLDPGITPDRVSMSEGLLPPGSKLHVKAYEPEVDSCRSPDDEADYPARLAADGKGFRLAIMSTEGLRKTGWDIGEMERTVRPNAVSAKPAIEPFDDHRLDYWGKLETFEAKSWRGLRWVGQYSQEHGALRNPLTYVVAALSNDRKFYILLWTDIEYIDERPELFQLDSDRSDALINDQKYFEAFQRGAEAVLTNAPPSSFKPDLYSA